MAATNRPITRALKIAYELNFDQLNELVSPASSKDKPMANVMGADMPVVERGEKEAAKHKEKLRILDQLKHGVVPVPDPRPKDKFKPGY